MTPYHWLAAFVAVNILDAVMLAEAAPWLPWLTGVFAAICAWNAGQIVKLRKG
jgi:hypothetical protein